MHPLVFCNLIKDCSKKTNFMLDLSLINLHTQRNQTYLLRQCMHAHKLMDSHIHRSNRILNLLHIQKPIKMNMNLELNA